MHDVQVSAQIALGKFYLHPWDSQVLVDWAKSQVQRGDQDNEIVVLSRMENASRGEILDQFDDMVSWNDLEVDFDETVAITAYLEDLRDRVLSGAIDARAAFAQVRHLAYDLEGLQLSGLSELDEDLNLLDSDQPAYNYPEMTAANAEVYIRTFFREMSILQPLPPVAKTSTAAPARDLGSARDRELIRWIESLALAAIIGLLVMYLVILVAKLKGL